MEFNIRKYQTKDCDAIIKLFFDTVHTINSKDYTIEQLKVWAPREVNRERWNDSLLKHYSVVATIRDRIVGFGDLEDTGYLDRLYVHKDYQGIGIATKIANELEEYALRHKINVITTHASITAKPFFERRGYQTIQQQEVKREDQSLTNFIMSKGLTLRSVD